MLLALTVLLLAPPVARAATTLSNPQVSPRTVVQGGTVTFTVETTGNANVTVQVELARSGAATIVRDLTALPKTGSTTTWQFQSTAIPAGTWSVTYAIAGSTTTLASGTLTVSPLPTPAPTPTPRVTPGPTPTPTPRRTLSPRPTATAAPPTATQASSPGAAASGVASPAASGQPSNEPSGTPGIGPGGITGRQSPGLSGSGSGGNSGDGDRTGQLLLSILLGLFVIAGVAGIAILTARRRSEDRPPPARAAATFVATRPGPAAEAFQERTLAAPAPAPRTRPSWEAYSALENEPIGTVDDLGADAGVLHHPETPGPGATSPDEPA